jgi:hypothetical protein
MMATPPERVASAKTIKPKAGQDWLEGGGRVGLRVTVPKICKGEKELSVIPKPDFKNKFSHIKIWTYP